MMKKPTTKKLPEKQVERTVTVTAKGKPFMKLFSDEKFYQYPRYTNVFVSQYGNVISTFGKTPHLLSLQHENNNYLSVWIRKKGKKKKFYIHRLVAEVWCQKPDFEIPNCPLQVHHKLKVLRNSTIDVNFAINLEYLYKPHHKAIIEKQVYVEQIQVITNGTIASEEAVTALNKAYKYITENCVDWEYPVHIGISTDYHDNQSSIQTVYNFYKQQCKFDVRLHQVDLSDTKQLSLAYSGRAKTLTNINEHLDPINHKICTTADGKVLCMLDLTLTGNFVLATQHSFQDADNPENILCPVDGNLLLAIMQWNYNHPLNCEEVKVKAWTQHTLDTGNYFGKKATAHDYEICKQSLEYYNDTEIYRKEVHEQFPALYPDDIENISNMSEEQPYLCCQIQATLLQRMRSSTPIDTSCWCTCPKKESQN